MRTFKRTDGMYDVYFDDYLNTYVYQKRFQGWDLVWLAEENERRRQRDEKDKNSNSKMEVSKTRETQETPHYPP